MRMECSLEGDEESSLLGASCHDVGKGCLKGLKTVVRIEGSHFPNKKMW